MDQPSIMDSKFDKLEEMTNQLPAIPKVEQIKQDLDDCGKTVEYPVEGGHCFSHSLFTSEETSVARTFVSAGAILPDHKHDEKEFIIIYSGSVMVRSSDDQNNKVVKPGGIIIYDPGVVHYARALEDSWFISMAVPHSNDFPQ